MTTYTNKRKRTEAGIWQEVEFGSYVADLPLWKQLTRATQGPVLELGAGAGRVTLEICGEYSTEGGWYGPELIALENDADLIRELKPKAQRMHRAVRFVHADLALPERIRLPATPELIIGPLHVIQVLDAAARQRLLQRFEELSAPGATLALSVVDESTMLSAGGAATQILPDIREVAGSVYSSEPLWVQVGDEALTVRRLRERVSPDGRMDRSVHDEILHRVSPEKLELEGRMAGFEPSGRRQISSGPNEADSIVVLLEANG